MNEQNYCTLPAAQRLEAKGIVLETEAVWVLRSNGVSESKYDLIPKPLFPYREQDPAPSMAEVWRELPVGSSMKIGYGDYFAWLDECRSMAYHRNNPTDALIDLLIFVVEQKGKEKV